MSNKPYAESCDQNRDVILDVIQPLLVRSRSVLEIGSGTGQHAVYFAVRMPHLVWQCSDREENLPGIRSWLQDAALENTPDPISLDVDGGFFEKIDAEVVFSANTVHIMSWPSVQNMFKTIAAILPPGGQFLLYGPFNYGGQYSSESNARFDIWLKGRDQHSGIRNFEDLQDMARQLGLTLSGDFEMPANNRILHWRKNN